MVSGKFNALIDFNFSSKNPYDINSPSFDPELYTQRLIKEASLAQLMAHENETVKQIHSLDSDMQTLVRFSSFFKIIHYSIYLATTPAIYNGKVKCHLMSHSVISKKC